MDIQRQFPGVHWIWSGGISNVYEVHPLIVVKVPKSGEEEREQFRKELNIYELLSRHPPCPSVVQCFLSTPDGIFLEYMRDISLAYRKELNLTRDIETKVVIKVKSMEPLPLQKLWMNDIAQGVAFLGSLNLAHGDLRPENILLDRNRLKLSDFDWTAEFGTDFEVCYCPYGRILNSSEADQGMPGTAGVLSIRTEQFALGSLFYYIHYGFAPYDNHRLVDDPYEHGPKVLDLFQYMKYPKLNGDPQIDDIIDKCWHYKYRTLEELATDTETLFKESTINGDDEYNVKQEYSDEELSSKQEFCRNLEKRGLLRLLMSGDAIDLGFSMEHRYVLDN